MSDSSTPVPPDPVSRFGFAREIAIVLGIALVVLLWVGGSALARSGIEVLPVGMHCEGKAMPYSTTNEKDEDGQQVGEPEPGWDIDYAKVGDYCQIYLEVQNHGKVPVRVRSYTVHGMARSPLPYEPFELGTDDGRITDHHTVDDSDVVIDVGETVGPGDSIEIGYPIQKRADFCSAAGLRWGAVAILHLRAFGIRGDETPSVHLKIKTDGRKQCDS